MLKKLSKQKKNDLITYGIVIVAFIAMQILIGSGQISSLFQGLMVPLCTYIILVQLLLVNIYFYLCNVFCQRNII